MYTDQQKNTVYIADRAGRSNEWITDLILRMQGRRNWIVGIGSVNKIGRVDIVDRSTELTWSTEVTGPRGWGFGIVDCKHKTKDDKVTRTGSTESAGREGNKKRFMKHSSLFLI